MREAPPRYPLGDGRQGMRLRKLLDGVTLRFCGLGLIFMRGERYLWIPRYDADGKIYMWLRENKPGDYAKAGLVQ